jgi:hypothetical protein
VLVYWQPVAPCFGADSWEPSQPHAAISRLPSGNPVLIEGCPGLPIRALAPGRLAARCGPDFGADP